MNYNRKWIIENSISVFNELGSGLTLRGLHYKLVARGMTNNISHYKKVVSAMKKARWDGTVAFDAFLDYERETIGQTEWEETSVDSSTSIAQYIIENQISVYRKSMWENQPNYVEVFIEKKSMRGVFEKTCNEWKVALNPCKGYPSLTFLYDAKNRFESAIYGDKKPFILYFGDYDCSGEDIPRSIVENLSRLGADVTLERVSLLEEQVLDWGLPPAPTKSTDSRGAVWNGLGQVELEAVEPSKLVVLCNKAIRNKFDLDLYEELKEVQAKEKIEFKEEMEIFVRDYFE